MKRIGWMKQVGFCLSVVVALAGLAWADPIGTADVRQILDPSTQNGASHQRTFRTTDGNITFLANYYDSNAACDGVSPTFVVLIVFNLEGVVHSQTNAGSFVGPLGPTYRVLNVGIDATAFGVGSWKFTFLVRDCTNTFSLILPELVTFRIVAP